MNKIARANVWKYYLAAFLAGISFFYNSIETLYYREFNLSFQQIGLLVSGMLITTIILEIPTGAFGDLYGKKKTLVIAAIFNLIATILVGLGSGFTIFFLGFINWGIGRAFASGAGSALLYDSLQQLGQEHLFMKHSGRMQAIFVSVDIISGGLGPILFASNIRLPFFISIIAALLVIPIRVSMHEIVDTSQRAEKVFRDHIDQMYAGIKEAFKSKIFVWLTVFSILIVVFGKAFAEIVSGPFFVNDVGFSLRQLSIILIIASLIQSLVVFFSYRIDERLGDKKSFYLVILGFSFSLLIVALTSSLGLAAGFLGILYGVWSFSDVAVESYLSHTVPDDKRATILSVNSLIVSLVAVIGLPVLGRLMDHLSLQDALVFFAGTILVSGMLLLRLGVPEFAR